VKKEVEVVFHPGPQGIPRIHTTLNSCWEFPGISEFLRNFVGNLREFDQIVNFRQKGDTI